MWRFCRIAIAEWAHGSGRRWTRPGESARRARLRSVSRDISCDCMPCWLSSRCECEIKKCSQIGIQSRTPWPSYVVKFPPSSIRPSVRPRPSVRVRPHAGPSWPLTNSGVSEGGKEGGRPRPRKAIITCGGRPGREMHCVKELERAFINEVA